MIGDIDRAIADFTQVIRLNPTDAMAYNNRGKAYTDKKDYARAIADFTEALRLDPDLAEARDFLESLRQREH
jgi:tetratricopeptide (TPR) repeat protein